MTSSTDTEVQKQATTLTEVARSFESALGTVLLGKPSQVRLATAALLSGQHLLLNDLPGVGKTTLGSSLAKTIDGTFGRVQGTPDLLPSDLTGVTVYSQRTEEWTFRAGPLFFQHCLGRRAEPNYTPQPVRALGGHGGRSRDRRWRESSAP